MARFWLGGMRLTNSLGLNLAVCELRDKCRSLHFLACRWESGPRYRGVYELHIHARLFCPRGGSPSEAVKAGQNSKPWLTDCLRSRSIHSLEVGLYNNQWVVSETPWLTGCGNPIQEGLGPPNLFGVGLVTPVALVVLEYPAEGNHRVAQRSWCPTSGEQ